MMVKFSGWKKVLCVIGVFCLFSAGFMGISGCSDTVEDLVDLDVEAEADLELPPVTVTKTAADGQRGALVVATEKECGTANIQELYDSVEFEGKDSISIESILLEYIWVKYIAAWEPDTVTSFKCRLTLESVGEGEPTVVEVVETVIAESGTDWTPITLTEDARNFINAYLANRAADFDYCVTCEDAGTGGTVESYNVQYDVNLGVTIKGNI